MSAGCVRWLLNCSARAIASGSLACRSLSSRGAPCKDRPSVFTLFSSRSTLCTAREDSEPTPAKKKKQSTHNNASLISVGRKIPHRLIHLLGESGDDMGTVNRLEALKIMDKQGLKLVLLSENKEPPVYRLMSGKQIQEERLMLREKQKAMPAPVHTKALTLTSGITTHDLSTKLKQVENWLGKKHHVKITLRPSNRSTVNLDTTLESMVQKIEVDFGFASKLQLIKEGKAAMCTLRPPSAKELAQKSKKTQTTASRTESSSTKDTTDTSVQE